MIKTVFNTFLSKFGVVLLNFLLVILTTQLWGSEGKGAISILVADMAIVAIVNNVLSGSSVSYFIPRMGLKPLLSPAFIWILIGSVLSGGIFGLLQPSTPVLILIGISLVNSLSAFNLCIFVGLRKLRAYNILNFLVPALTVFFILICEFVFKIHSINSYFLAFFLSQTIVWAVGLWSVRKNISGWRSLFSFDTVVTLFSFGWKNELSYFLQFLNYRLSFYFVLYYRDIASVGVLSVGVAMAESIWLVSRSITTVQYSKMINLTDAEKILSITKRSAKLSLYLSIILTLALILFPANGYGLIFGKDFSTVKPLLFLLIPGIISNALTNVYGHYFSATNQLWILVKKSLWGLIVTILLSLVIVPKWGAKGSCMVASCSYLISSLYLFVMFNKANKIRLTDFYINFADLKQAIGRTN
jgi:O-antigen/teichoic acid export membrane protein